MVDSYRERADDARSRPRARLVVAIDDLARDLAVDLVIDPSPGADLRSHHRARRVLAGAAYALVPAAATRVCPSSRRRPVERVLVTTGAADAGGVGARSLAASLCLVHGPWPAVEVRLVVGEWGSAAVPPGVVVVNVHRRPRRGDRGRARSS